MGMLRGRIEVVRVTLTGAAAPSRILAIAMALVFAACETPAPSASQRPSEATPTPTAGPQVGGTIYLLTYHDNWSDIDPQRVVTAEDQAFFSGTIYRSLLTYAYSPDYIAGTTLMPDLATDLGTPTEGGRTWTFTLRDGITWEDGSPLICEDIAYGVSRTFATRITGGGPAHAIRYLDIPMGDDGASDYPGPYEATPEEQALFDAAVACDRNTVTFRLNQPVGDFNDATTLGMSPVPNPSDHPEADIGEGYGVTSKAWSSGPYRVASYEPGLGGSMELVRNEHWVAGSDDIRKAYPDRWVVEFGLDPREVDRRLMHPSGNAEFALQYGEVQPENLSTIFADAQTPKPAFGGRVVSAFGPYSQYYWVNVEAIPNEKIRQALGVALNREALRDAFAESYGGSGYGALYGDYADGLIMPSIGQDYAATGYYEGLFGFPISAEGDPAAARRLIAESGEDAPTLRWNYHDSPIGSLHMQVVQESLEQAGFTIEPGPLFDFPCYNLPCLPVVDGDFGNTGSGRDWPNASTVIPRSLIDVTMDGLPKAADADFEASVQAAIATLDRAEQARKWQALNREAVQRGWIIPSFFPRTQTLAGPKVGPIYRWSAYGSWPYGVMYVVP